MQNNIILLFAHRNQIYINAQKPVHKILKLECLALMIKIHQEYVTMYEHEYK